MADRLSRLVIVSHVVHYRHANRWHAYGPYAREIDIWADLFPEVVIASPVRHMTPPGDAVAFTRTNIEVAAQRESGGDAIGAKLKQLGLLPLSAMDLVRTMRHADAIHVRCPGNLGLLGAMLAPLCSRHLVAKYAGQWNGYRDEPISGRLQRWILGSRWWRGPVTVYGRWSGQPRHVIPFFTSMMTRAQVRRAAVTAANKRLESPLRILFSGMLQRRKRVDALIQATALLRDRGVAFELAVVGDGAERAALLALATELGVADHVRFIGSLPFDRALEWYDWAHVLVLPSRHSEGWPKVVAEAMAHGLVCVAVDHGQVAHMLEGRGVALPTGSAEEVADALTSLAADPSRFDALRRDAQLWASQHSLEDLRDALSELLTAWWAQPISVDSRRSGGPEMLVEGRQV